MKNLKLLLVALLAVVTISSCMKSNDNGNIDYEQNLKRIDSTLNAQKTALKDYAEQKFGDDAKLDTATGIWYEVLPSTVDSTFEYVAYGNSWVPVVAQVKYKGELMDGKVFDEKTTPTQFSINGNSILQSWLYVFYPKNTSPNSFSGLLPHGLLKGNKIKFITPSPWGYDNTVKENIPKDSPLIFTVEVTGLSLAN